MMTANTSVIAKVAAVLIVVLGVSCQTGRQQDGDGMPADTAGMQQDTAAQDTAMQDTASDTDTMQR
ncbi:MAG: hypothetical protein GF331_06865 [Chitinivibrionales bacterium]|nr:hypothetical protein [Chitinivibrionales bacterium]